MHWLTNFWVDWSVFCFNSLSNIYRIGGLGVIFVGWVLTVDEYLNCHRFRFSDLFLLTVLLFYSQAVGLEETLELFMNLQLIGDRSLRKLMFSHIVHSIRRMNKNHKNVTQNRKLQNILFPMLQVWILLCL